MADFVKSLLGLILRLGLLLAGLVFFASVLAAGLLLLALWLLRTLWAKATGQPVQPWVFKFNRRASWRRPGRNTGSAADTSGLNADIVDVVAKPVNDSTDVDIKRIDRSH